MRFLIDENVRLEIETFLVKAGHDVRRVAPGSENGEIIQLAFTEKRVLVTHDLHFANILIYPPERYCGIIRIRIDPPLASKVLPALQKLLEKVAPEKFNKKLYVLEEDGFRAK